MPQVTSQKAHGQLEAQGLQGRVLAPPWVDHDCNLTAAEVMARLGTLDVACCNFASCAGSAPTECDLNCGAALVPLMDSCGGSVADIVGESSALGAIIESLMGLCLAFSHRTAWNAIVALASEGFCEKLGCMDHSAYNYDPTATVHDGVCDYPPPDPGPYDPEPEPELEEGTGHRRLQTSDSIDHLLARYATCVDRQAAAAVPPTPTPAPAPAHHAPAKSADWRAAFAGSALFGPESGSWGTTGGGTATPDETCVDLPVRSDRLLEKGERRHSGA